MSTPNVRKVCPHCGGDDLVTDGACRWSVEEQKWELVNLYDQEATCQSCDRDVREVDEPAE